MSDIKLFRWATYLLPGSLVVFPTWMLLEMVSGVRATEVLKFEHSSAFLILAFLGLSYATGMGLWGIGYHPFTQRILFKSHSRRLRDIRTLTDSAWYKRRKFPDRKKYFPSLKGKTTRDEDVPDAYHDFELAIVEACTSKNKHMVDRIIQQRETIGLLQALILGVIACSLLLTRLALTVFLEDPAKSWRPAVGLFCGAVAAILLLFALRVHYKRRQYYLVRDVLLTLLADEEQEA